jgi:hypothetical protein
MARRGENEAKVHPLDTWCRSCNFNRKSRYERDGDGNGDDDGPGALVVQTRHNPSLDPRPIRCLTTSPSCSPQWASQDEDPLAFLSLDVPMPGVYDWSFRDQVFNMFEPLHTTGRGNGSWRNSELADFGVGFMWYGINPYVPRGRGVGGGEKKGLL